MEQNLSEQERNIRLGMGSVFLILTIASYFFYNNNNYVTGALAITGVGLILNYFTCFCGTKKLLNSFKSRLTN